MWATWRRRLESGRLEVGRVWVSTEADGEHSSREALGYLFTFPSNSAWTGHGMAGV